MAAIDALRKAITTQPTDTLVVEERSVWQPDSWLIQRCWQELADAGCSREALATANLASERYPLAPIQTIQRLAKQTNSQPGLSGTLHSYLLGIVTTLNSPNHQLAQQSEIAQSAEGLLAASVAALRLGDAGLSLAFLERLDQLRKGWEQIITKPEPRQMLAEIVAHQSPHPLINALVSSALRRFGDAGAIFLHEITHRIDPEPRATGNRSKTILNRCVDAFRFGMLATPQSQRYAIASYGRAGLFSEAMQQADTLTNILEARRHSALDRQADQNIVRQVKRPTANADADFQINALTEAIRSMGVHKLERDQRVVLANRLATIARRSDGWSAASAAQTLVELGALKFATEAIGRIAANDPTRVEAVISLVRALLGVTEFEAASEQVEKALAWAEQTEQGRLRKQALIRGLGEVYLADNQPNVTWQLLDRAIPPPTLRSRIQGWFGERWNDDTLRNEALRLRALLHPEGIRLTNEPQAVANLLAKLLQWGKELLEGEALVNFYLDSLLRPLLEAGLVSQVWTLLNDLELALGAISGDKHANRVHTVCTLLAEQALPLSFAAGADSTSVGAASVGAASVVDRLGQFLQRLWRADAQRNVWQTVHGIEGSLPLLIVLEGAQSVLAIAQVASSIIGNAENVVIDSAQDGGEHE